MLSGRAAKRVRGPLSSSNYPSPGLSLRSKPPSPARGEVKKAPMDAREVIKIGMNAERSLVVPAERTVGHFVKGMPMVYATPMMILEMEMASSDAIRPHLQPGWITVGTEVDIRHLGASLVGATVRVTGKGHSGRAARD